MAVDLLTLHASGQLFHHFHGDYSATVLLVFATPEDAALAHARLPQAGRWKAGSKPQALVWHGDRGALETLKLALRVEITPCGMSHCRTQCKREAIDSCAHSIDAGPLFRVAVRAEHPAQVAFPIFATGRA